MSPAAISSGLNSDRIAVRFLLPAIAIISAVFAALTMLHDLVFLGFLLALLATAVLWRIKPRPLEILFFLIPMFTPTIPAFTGLSKHYILVTVGWTALFLLYWYFQSLSGAWQRASIRTPYIYPLVIYRLIFTVSILSHPLHRNALSYTLQSLAIFGVYWILVQTLQGQNLKRLLEAIIWGSIISMVAFLAAFSLGSPRYLILGLMYGVLRPVVMDYNANFWAWATLVGMPLAMAFVVHGLYRKGKLVVMLAGMFVMLISALVCNSRSALMAIATSTLFIMLTHAKARIRFLMASAGFLILIFLIVPQAWNLALSVFRVKMGLTGRVFIWNLAWNYITDHPLTGIGPGWFYERLAVDVAPVRDSLHLITGRISAHNTLLMTATDIGLLGILPLLFIMGFFTWRSMRLWRKLKGTPDLPYLIAICALMIAGVTRSLFETDFIYLHSYLVDNLILLIVLAVQDRLYSQEFSSA